MQSYENLIALDRRYLWHPFTQEQTAPDPIPIVAGRGATLVAADGREYLDLIASWWVNILGHTHPAIARAIGEQAQRLEQVIFAGFTHEPAVELARRLVEVLPEGLDRVFFSDNGSTAVEVALKMAYQYQRNREQPQRTRFLAFQDGYHGDTVGAMSVGISSGFYGPFQDLLFQVDLLPYPATWEGDGAVAEKETAAIEVLEEYVAAHPGELAAIIIEPLVQGAGGMRMCRPAFLRSLAAAARRAGALLIFDEVMTGFGRTGALFAALKAGVTPDLICLSKGLTGGFLPLSATVCREEIYRAFLDDSFAKAFAHGHSFTANPIGCAAALASLTALQEEHALDRVATIEALHRDRLTALATRPSVEHIRVTGVIGALDVTVPDSGYTAAVGPRLKQYFMDRGLLIRPLGNVLYLMPPYCVTDDQLHHAYDTIEAALDEIVGG